MLHMGQRRACRKRAETVAKELLEGERTTNGVDGLESSADGMIDAIGRELSRYISPEYAFRMLQDAADRLSRHVLRRGD